MWLPNLTNLCVGLVLTESVLELIVPEQFILVLTKRSFREGLGGDTILPGRGADSDVASIAEEKEKSEYTVKTRINGIIGENFHLPASTTSKLGEANVNKTSLRSNLVQVSNTLGLRMTVVQNPVLRLQGRSIISIQGFVTVEQDASLVVEIFDGRKGNTRELGQEGQFQ
jgi:hypothetical protein